MSEHRPNVFGQLAHDASVELKNGISDDQSICFELCMFGEPRITNIDDDERPLLAFPPFL
jgi:hypothetical protein